jgi:hypothetical protein
VDVGTPASSESRPATPLDPGRPALLTSGVWPIPLSKCALTCHKSGRTQCRNGWTRFMTDRRPRNPAQRPDQAVLAQGVAAFSAATRGPSTFSRAAPSSQAGAPRHIQVARLG